MQLFSADNTIFFFAHENMKKTASKVANNQPNFFFSIANRPKINTNLIFCSIKMAPCATSSLIPSTITTQMNHQIGPSGYPTFETCFLGQNRVK